MISVNAIGSSSKGNAYIIDSGNSKLMLECGISWRKIKEAIHFKTSDVDGILISHSHLDHCKAVKDATKAGLDVYLSKETAEAISATGHRIHHIEAGKQFKIATWTIMPFETVHLNSDGSPCLGSLGFLIVSGTDRLLFLTDSAYCKHLFSGLTHIMIEANFSNEILDRNVKSGTISNSRRKRLLDSHFSLNRVVDFIKANNMSKLREIYLLHLSSQNSDEELFKRTIQGLTGVPVIVCGE